MIIYEKGDWSYLQALYLIGAQLKELIRERFSQS